MFTYDVISWKINFPARIPCHLLFLCHMKLMVKLNTFSKVISNALPYQKSAKKLLFDKFVSHKPKKMVLFKDRVNRRLVSLTVATGLLKW